MDDPRRNQRQELVNESVNILFVCSRNQWRSPTAEAIYRNHPMVNVRSAGVASSARHQVTAADIEWADVVIAMEDQHLVRLRADYPAQMKSRESHVLNIPDEYKYMDPDLVDEIRAAVDPLIAPNAQHGVASDASGPVDP